MGNKLFLTILLTLFVSSCATNRVNVKSKSGPAALTDLDEVYRYEDRSGKFQMRMSNAKNLKNKTYSTKKVLQQRTSGSKILEQSIAISNIGQITKSKLNVLRPNISQYNVWFDGKKYASEIKLDATKRVLNLKMNSPEAEFNGARQISLPRGSVLPCFFTQIIDCAKISGFIRASSMKKTGAMNLLVLWEGYPFLSDTYTDLPSEIFSTAVLEYDGELKNSQRRYNLRVAGQSIFYILNEDDEIMKMLWVSQGVSMIHRSQPDETTTSEGEF